MIAPVAALILREKGPRASTDTLWRAGVLAALFALAVVRVLVLNNVTQDDVFFLDAASQLVDGHGFVLGIWGNALGHETFLASYPPLAAAVVTPDVWLLDLTRSALVVKSTSIVLQLGSAALLWRALRFIHPTSLRAVVVFAAFVEPVSMTFYFTLRPEPVLLLLMLALFLSADRMFGDSGPARASLIVASMAAAFSHYQFATTLALLVLTLALDAIGRRRRAGFAVLYAATIGACYAAWAGWILASPQRTLAFQQQIIGPASTGGFLTRVKFLVGNLLAGDLAAGSGFSIVAVVALLVLLVRLTGSGAAGRPREPMRALFQLGFLAAALLPALGLNYIGPRAIPIYLVAIVILAEAAVGPRRLPAPWLAAMGVVAALVNFAGNALIQRLYLDRAWIDAIVAMPLAWLAVVIGVLWLARRTPDARRAGVAALVGVATISAAGDVSLLTRTSLPAQDGIVRRIAAELPRADLTGHSVLCDVRIFYLPLRQYLAPARIYATFPLLHFTESGLFDRFISDMRPDVILGSEALEGELQTGTPAARRFLEWRDREFTLARTFAVDGYRMSMYSRKRPDGAERRP